jgi:hypothetical protein
VEYALFNLVVLYFLPWIVSEVREHESRSAILALNLTTGWTGIGWLGALIWAGAPAQGSGRFARPSLRVVADPKPGRAGRGRRVMVAALGVLGLAAGWQLLRPVIDTEMRRQVVTAAGLELREAPDAARPVVARLPAGCVVAQLERRGEWRRVWRTADCPGAEGRAAGWTASR